MKTGNFLRFLAVLVLGAAALAAPCHAQGRIRAQFSIEMTGVPIGQIGWLIDIGAARYTTSAHGKASGVLSVLFKGEGSIVAHGNVADAVFSPTYFTSDIIDEDGTSALRMTFDEGGVKELVAPPEPPHKDRVPVAAADLRGVIDPLTAMLLPTGDDPMVGSTCNRMVRIFDGRRRYNLLMTFKRLDTIKIETGYSGKVLVCNVALQPVSGHRAGSILVKYVVGRRDLELWLVPVAAKVVAPVRIVVPTLLGTLEISAEQFVALPPVAEPQ